MLLIDAPRLKDKDRDVMKTLDAAAVTYQIALTKADKVKAADLARIADEVRPKPPLMSPPFRRSW
jgi:GTP-binding protein